LATNITGGEMPDKAIFRQYGLLQPEMEKDPDNGYLLVQPLLALSHSIFWVKTFW
jgi:hypothetical protein